MRNAIFIKIQSVPLLKQVEEECDRKNEPHLEICQRSLGQMFKFANLLEQPKDGFDQHSPLPFTVPTNLQIFRLVDFTSKAGIRQYILPVTTSTSSGRNS
jgi:hypothetical protein